MEMVATKTHTKSTIMPTLRYKDAPAAIEWLCQVLRCRGWISDQIDYRNESATFLIEVDLLSGATIEACDSVARCPISLNH